jgi:hypothetical protein
MVVVPELRNRHLLDAGEDDILPERVGVGRSVDGWRCRGASGSRFRRCTRVVGGLGHGEWFAGHAMAVPGFEAGDRGIDRGDFGIAPPWGMRQTRAWR